jgi:hypothetical protein
MQGRPVRRIPRSPDERGFVLITALWLLLLCGAVVALMMLRSASRVEVNRAAAIGVQTRLDLESAVETVVADILLRGPQSQWARSPARGSMEIAGHSVTVEVSSEAGRLDLNDGDTAIIGRALQGLGVAASQREAFIAALQQLRVQQHRITNSAEVDRLEATSGIASALCIDDDLTLFSGLSRPSEMVMPAELAHALAVPQAGGGPPTAISPGTAIRIRARSGQGASLLAVVRPIGTQDRIYDVLRWTEHPGC